MKFKTDENIPDAATEHFRSLGLDAISVPEQRLAGEPDPLIAEVCRAEDRVIVTADKGFGNIHEFPPEDYAGIVVVRPKLMGPGAITRLVMKVAPKFGTRQLRGRLWIVEDDRVRVRGEGIFRVDLPGEVED